MLLDNPIIICRNIARTSLALVLLVAPIVTKAVPITIIDSLGSATTDTTFATPGSSGTSILDFQHVGPLFSISRRTRILEIGAFINNFSSNNPMDVTVYAASGIGTPDLFTSFGSFTLSSDNAPGIWSFESVKTNLWLDSGSYFALFSPQNDDFGALLSTASDPFPYRAESIVMGFADPITGITSASQQFGAVRIIGVVSEPSTGLLMILGLFSILFIQRYRSVALTNQGNRHAFPS